MRFRTLAVGALFLGSPSPAAPPADRDWAATLVRDAQAMHDELAANHPGAVNSLDPGFALNNERQLKIALEHAKTARTYADYFFPLRIYAASFNDGHLNFGALGNTPNDLWWPGFLTRYDGRGRIVVATREPGSPVPFGAELVACDSMTASRYAEATLGKMWGRWQLESQHQSLGSVLFLDESSRLIPRAHACTFRVGSKKRPVTLDWRPFPIVRFASLLSEMKSQAKREFAVRDAANGLKWVSLPSFSGDPGSDATRALPGLLKRMQAHREVLLGAPAIVLDLRGNGGGTSDWSRQIADIIWGRKAISGLPRGHRVEVDWRASPANLAAIATAYAERRGTAGFSADADHWYRSVLAGLGVAIARKQKLWRHVAFEALGEDPPSAAAASRADTATTMHAPTRPIFVLTDFTCASACLDALELWKALGAIHVGRQTSADTLYMEVRNRTLPSGLTSISIPMKVYRGRSRGSNEPEVPVHRFTGDLADTPTLERWIAGLVSKSRH